MNKSLRLTIDQSVLDEYSSYYFSKHPRASKIPIPHPYHESINKWMIMKRPMMNALKQKWKDFIVWFVDKEGYSNLRIEKCEIVFTAYYPNNRRHDVDNSCPKFIIDGMCDSGLIVDDDCLHLTKITLMCGTDIDYPRTEIDINFEIEERKENEYGEKD